MGIIYMTHTLSLTKRTKQSRRRHATGRTYLGDVLANYFKDATMILTPILMAYFSNWLRKFLARYHMTAFQGMIERHADQIVSAETNKAAITIEGTGNKIQWSGVIADSVKQLLEAHSALSVEQAQSMTNAVMAKIPGIGPIDVGGQDGQGNGIVAAATGSGPALDPNSPLGRLAAACKKEEAQAATDLPTDPLNATVEKAEKVAGEKTVDVLTVHWGGVG